MVVVEVVVKLWCLTFVKRTHFTRSNTRVISNINDRGTRGVPNIFKLRYFYSNMLRSTSIYTSQHFIFIHTSQVPSINVCLQRRRENKSWAIGCMVFAGSRNFPPTYRTNTTRDTIKMRCSFGQSHCVTFGFAIYLVK